MGELPKFELLKYGYAGSWAEVKPLLEEGVKGIGLVKMEDQFVIPKASARNPFTLESVMGSDMVYYYLMTMMSRQFSGPLGSDLDNSLGNVQVYLQKKFRKECSFYLEKMITAGETWLLPYGIRLLDPEIILSRYLEPELISRRGLGQDCKDVLSLIFADLEPRIGPEFQKTAEPLTEEVERLSQDYRTRWRGSDFCLEFPWMTGFQVDSITGVIHETGKAGACMAILYHTFTTKK